MALMLTVANVGAAAQTEGAEEPAERSLLREALAAHLDHCGGPEAKRLMQLANDALGWLKAA